jgi:pimeloyl-ACP methyl ester carboxylesterase
MWLSAERSLTRALLVLSTGLAGLSTLPLSMSPLCAQTILSPATHCNSYSAEVLAHNELSRAAALEAVGDEECVDASFLACFHAWQGLTKESNACQSTGCWQCYNDAVENLIRTALRFERLDPARGLMIDDGSQFVTVPVTHAGFPWCPADFQILHPTPSRHHSKLQRHYRRAGIGLPLVVERCRNTCSELEARFFPERSFFAATVLLRFPVGNSDSADSTSPATSAVLEFHNPLLCGDGSKLPASELPMPLAANFSAPLDVQLPNTPSTYFTGFVDPADPATSPRLDFREPYQPQRIPLVLVHGLYSDPSTWGNLINDLQATPGFSERYQIWTFRYPTGQGFLLSAAELRKQTRAALAALDPHRCDPALRQMVLVGHSMGGLISKLQVSYSREEVWSRLANRPLDEIVTTPSTHALLASTCYFEPTPDVRRVIFIATPNCGALPAVAVAGSGASKLVEEPQEMAVRHRQLIRDNPCVFSREIERRFPTSVDLLGAKSPLLTAMRLMEIAPCVKLHNIIGVSHPISCVGPSDGVVPVESAEHPWCESVLPVRAAHAKVHTTRQASVEIVRILECHWAEYLGAAGAMPGTVLDTISLSSSVARIECGPLALRAEAVRREVQIANKTQAFQVAAHCCEADLRQIRTNQRPIVAPFPLDGASGPP